MTVLCDKDEQVLKDYLVAYKECFEAMNDLLNSVTNRVQLNEEEIKLATTADMKYKNMLYHIRKWTPEFRKKINQQ